MRWKLPTLAILAVLMTAVFLASSPTVVAEFAPPPTVEIIPEELEGVPVEQPVVVFCQEGVLLQTRPTVDGASYLAAKELCIEVETTNRDFGCPEPKFYDRATEADGCLRQFPSFQNLKRIIMYYGSPSHSESYRTTGLYNNYVGHDSGSSPGTAITWYKSRDGGAEVGLQDPACHTYSHWKSDHSDMTSSVNHWHGTQMEAGIRAGQFSACDTNGIAKGYWGGAVDFK